jgi:hypothetical protein
MLQYHKIYKRVISEAKKRHNDRQIVNAANPNEVMWQIINKKWENQGKLIRTL